MKIAGADVVVVGGGPAGLAAGMHLSRAGYRTLLLEKGELGGQAGRIERIENYPGFPSGISGRDLMALWKAQARRWRLGFLKAEARTVERRGGSFRLALSQGRSLRSRAVICCAGAEFERLGVPGEDALWGRGVHATAFEAARRFRGHAVAVVGAGEAALHQALLLAKFARRVTLLSRGPDIKAHRLLKSRMSRCSNLAHRPHAAVERIEGRDKLESVVVRGAIDGRRESLQIAGLFVLIGKRGSRLFPKARGPGYFVAGDASGGICRQVVVAAGRGVEAAMKCIRYLEGWDRS